MGVMSDRWIRHMATEHAMIRPFEADQVRRLDGCGSPIISYGTSSYGYDVRCGDRFKVFTNVGAREVDPKAFDDRNVVEVEGDTAGSRRTRSRSQRRSNGSRSRAGC